MLTNEQRRLVSDYYNLALVYSRKSCRHLNSQERVKDVATDGLLTAALKFDPLRSDKTSFEKFLQVSVELTSHSSWRRLRLLAKETNLEVVEHVASTPVEPTLDQRLERAITLIQKSNHLPPSLKKQYVCFLQLRHSGLPLRDCAKQMGIHRNRAARIESAILKFFKLELNHDD